MIKIKPCGLLVRLWWESLQSSESRNECASSGKWSSCPKAALWATTNINGQSAMQDAIYIFTVETLALPVQRDL